MRPALAFAIGLFVAGRALAQEPEVPPPPSDVAAPAEPACREGRVRTEGRCCWPGQTFSAADHVCSGAPRCPEGLVEHGEACVAPVVADDTAPAPASSAVRSRLAPPPVFPDATAAALAPPVSAWPRAHEGALSRPVRRSGEDGGLVAAAMVVFDVGWVLGWLVGMLDEATTSCRTFVRGIRTGATCATWPLTFVPVGGGLAAGLMNFGPGFRDTAAWGLVLGIPSVILEATGLVMMAVALANEVHDFGFVPLDDTGQVSLRILPGAVGADGGASLALTF